MAASDMPDVPDADTGPLCVIARMTIGINRIIMDMRSSTRLALDDTPLRQPHQIIELIVPAHAPAWARWLGEIGCFPGEPVTVLARAVPGGDPLVVRIGHSTFALRRAEAACIRVAPLP